MRVPGRVERQGQSRHQCNPLTASPSQEIREKQNRTDGRQRGETSRARQVDAAKPIEERRGQCHKRPLVVFRDARLLVESPGPGLCEVPESVRDEGVVRAVAPRWIGVRMHPGDRQIQKDDQCQPWIPAASGHLLSVNYRVDASTPEFRSRTPLPRDVRLPPSSAKPDRLREAELVVRRFRKSSQCTRGNCR